MRFVRLYYCYDCKAILFRHLELATIRSRSVMKRDEDGFEIETDFEIEHRSVNSCYCEECETKLYDTVQLPEDIYKKLYSVVTSRKGDNHIFYVDLENVNAIKPEDVKALLVAALI